MNSRNLHTYANHDDKEVEKLRRWSDNKCHHVAQQASQKCSQYHIHRNEPPSSHQSCMCSRHYNIHEYSKCIMHA